MSIRVERIVSATNTVSLSPEADMEVTAVHVQMTTTATVGNRFLAVSIFDAVGNFITHNHSASPQTASQAGFNTEFYQGVPRETTFDANHITQQSLPGGLVCPANGTIKVSDLANIDPADTITVGFVLKSIRGSA